MRRLLPLVIALAACGKVNTLADAPTGGDGNGADSASAVDGGFDADPHGTITVIVNAQSAPATPLAGVPVVFVDPDGHTTEAITDGSGTATATVAPGASVTAAYGTDSTFVQLETVREVSPGDTIVIGPIGGGGSGSSGTFTANVPDYPGSQTYDVYGPCGYGTGSAAGSGSATPVSFPVYGYCQDAAMDVLAIARNSDHNPDAWLDKSAVAYTDGGSTTLANAWKPFQTVSFSFSNVALSNVSVIDFSHWAPDEYGYQSSTYASLGTEPQTAQLTVPGATTVQIESTITHASGGGQQQLYDVVDGTKTTYAVDLRAALVPFIDFATFDASTETLTVPTQPGGTDPGDLLTVQLQYERTTNDTIYTYQWNLWSPPADSIVLPPLPTDLAALTPKIDDVIDNIADDLYAADAITDWSQIRGRLFGALDAYYTGRGGLGRFVWSYPTGVGLRGGSRGQRAPRIRR